MQGQSLEERQSCCTSPVVASCSREQRASGSAGAHQYGADLQVKTDEPATWEMMAATEEPMAEPAAEPPDETTEYKDDVRCGSGQSRGDSRRKAPSGVARSSDSKLETALEDRRGRWQPRRHRPSKFSRPLRGSTGCSQCEAVSEGAKVAERDLDDARASEASQRTDEYQTRGAKTGRRRTPSKRRARQISQLQSQVK